MSQNGKGDAPRPFSVSIDTYKSNWDRIFSNNDTCAYSGLPTTQSYSDSKEEYTAVRNSGMFFEFFPGLTGNWEEDKNRWESMKR
jgi:hypothetical protein